MEVNKTIMQFFEWNSPSDGNNWKRLQKEANHISDLGFTGIWIPPAYKGSSEDDVGYGVYDLYDLGEFDQKGTVRTKYGTKEELIDAINELHERNVEVYADVVVNHKAAADATERFVVVEVDSNDRNKEISDPYEIEGWTKFEFPGRENKYSSFKWRWYHFSGTDFNQENNKKAIYKIVGDGKGWSQGVSKEFGNYDYLMYADLDFKNPEVSQEIKNWGMWIANMLNLDGFRLDAVKHIDEKFMKEFLESVREEKGDRFFAIGEYWIGDVEILKQYLKSLDYSLNLFDVPLHYNIAKASKSGKDYDLRNIFKGTLVEANPMNAVTFVDNHDTQPGEALESFVDIHYNEIGYSLILLRKEGIPCVFYGDYYGISGNNPKQPNKRLLDPILFARKYYCYGDQIDYFDDKNCIGWIRTGNEDHPMGCAVILSNGDEGIKRMQVGKEHSGEVWIDFTENRLEEVTIDKEGFGEFKCNGMSSSIWIEKI